MNVFPAMKGVMGGWQYYVIKMTMRELASNVNFACDIHDDVTLDQAIQRVLNESRVRKEMVAYLTGQPDRFFSSIVVAALKGNPKWYPVTMEDDERFEIFRDDNRFSNSFGVLKFDGKQNYYALDGQHRLASIKALVDPNPNNDDPRDAPAGFVDEEVSVIVVVPREDESSDEFLLRYRRLFGNLNRYAKPTDAVTNIIMDEDDAFAILTRRLITDHEFFRYEGRQSESQKIKTKKGKNLRSQDPFFTTLETLYEMNITLLSSAYRKNHGWNPEGVSQISGFRQFRPTDEVLDSFFEELVLYWDAILEELPVLRESPNKMRDHSSDPSNEERTTQDSFLFWPIGQNLLAEIVRSLINFRHNHSTEMTVETVRTALKGLAQLSWDAHTAPWRNLALIPNDKVKQPWKIRNEDRKNVLDIVKQIFRWQLGLESLTTDDEKTLKERWQGFLLPAFEQDQMDEMWEEIRSGVQR